MRQFTSVSSEVWFRDMLFWPRGLLNNVLCYHMTGMVDSFSECLTSAQAVISAFFFKAEGYL